MSLFLILLAAGDSKRLKSDSPKPYCKVGSKTLIEHSLKAFEKFSQIKKIIVVYNKKHKNYINKLNLKNVIKITGGKNRQESVYKALIKIKKMKCKKVLIHDSARPYPSKIIIKKLIIAEYANTFNFDSLKENLSWYVSSFKTTSL